MRIHVTLLLAGYAFVTPVTGFEPANIVQATGSIEYALTPDDDATGVIIRSIDAAASQVLVQAFSFTHFDIAQALIRAHRRGLDVQIIADQEQAMSAPSAAMRALLRAGVPVFTDGEHGAAHNKVIILDQNAAHPGLITGSFNFTFAAQHKNAENVLVLRDNPGLAKAFYAGWRQHRAHAVATSRDR